jgi:hypothetical protein
VRRDAGTRSERSDRRVRRPRGSGPRPRLESAGLAKHRVGLRALVRLALLDDLGWKVVQEVRGEIKARAVTAALSRGDPRVLPSGVRPPLPRRLARQGDHAVDEDQHPYPRLRADERRSEAAERLRDEDRLARPDRLEHALGVDRQSGLRVVAGQVDGDRLVLRLLEQRHDTMPVPRNTTSAGNESEGRHDLRPLTGQLAKIGRTLLTLGRDEREQLSASWQVGCSPACSRRVQRRPARRQKRAPARRWRRPFAVR